MLEVLSKIVSNIFLYGASVSLERIDGESRIRVKLKDLIVKDAESEGIIIDELILSIVDVRDNKELSESLNEATFIVEKFSIFLSEDWLNKLLTEGSDLKKSGVENLRFDFKANKLSILGTLKKGISLSFSIDLKFSVSRGELTIDFNRFWAGDMIPLPRMVQKTILNIVRKHLTSNKSLVKGLRFHDRYITLDPPPLMPVDVIMELKNVNINEKFLVLQGSVNREKSMELVAQKVERRRKSRKEEAARKKEEKQLAGLNDFGASADDVLLSKQDDRNRQKRLPDRVTINTKGEMEEYYYTSDEQKKMKVDCKPVLNKEGSPECKEGVFKNLP